MIYKDIDEIEICINQNIWKLAKIQRLWSLIVENEALTCKDILIEHQRSTIYRYHDWIKIQEKLWMRRLQL